MPDFRHKDIYIQRAKSYQKSLLVEKIEAIFTRFKLSEKISAGDTVLLKVNLLMGKDPAEAVTTHPKLIEVLGAKLLELGARPLLADSPGGPFNKAALKLAYKKSGYQQGADSGLYSLNYDTSASSKDLPAGWRGKSYQICDFAEKADFIINLPKLKTHGLTLYTGAVKNLFGLIPGTIKAEYHLKMSQLTDFTHLLLDIAELISVDLTIMDAITGMEGAGPSSGTPRDFGLLLAAEDPYQLDLLVSRLLRGDDTYRQDPFPRAIYERYEQYNLEEGNITELPDWIKAAFKNVELPEVDRTAEFLAHKMPDFLAELLNKLLRPRPVFNANCVACGICQDNCPPEVIEIEDKKAEAELDDCIRCFCCQELCPHEAVGIKKPLLGRLFF